MLEHIIIPDTWDAEAGGHELEVSQGKDSKTPSQYKMRAIELRVWFK
jgi:hypothetical protein